MEVPGGTLGPQGDALKMEEQKGGPGGSLVGVFFVILDAFWDTIGTRFGLKRRRMSARRDRNVQNIGSWGSPDPPPGVQDIKCSAHRHHQLPP